MRNRKCDVRSVRLASVVLTAVGVSACSQSPTLRTQPSATSTTEVSSQPELFADEMDSFYLSTCPLCSAKLGSRGEAPELTYLGRGLRFCSAACVARFSADPQTALGAIDTILISDQRPHYPTSTSLIDSRPLGPAPLAFIWGNRLFLARDQGDRDAILRDPAAAIRTLDQLVIERQLPTYGMPNKCPVQGDILPNERRIDIVVANRMIRVCCGRCVRVVKARPYQYLSMVEYANREAAARRSEERGEP